ncbi:toll/interleukin-1 receptor domain-containing protein, partial [Gammaproteobacteria bacterium]|nr:toll/interleukin-1 receptor domain-containing protein [Gammaproteobacteria bacterium]
MCYAHEDAEIVYPEIAWLNEQNINIWYDEGISAGKIWRAEIARALEKANKFLFYISARSLDSDHCNREINFALDEGLDVIPIYLEEVDLTPDLRMGLNRVQALHRYQYTEERYQRALLTTLGVSPGEVQPTPIQPTPIQPAPIQPT